MELLYFGLRYLKVQKLLAVLNISSFPPMSKILSAYPLKFCDNKLVQLALLCRRLSGRKVALNLTQRWSAIDGATPLVRHREEACREGNTQGEVCGLCAWRYLAGRVRVGCRGARHGHWRLAH